MTFKQKIFIYTVIYMSISACGGSDSPSGNQAATTVDGAKQALTPDEDSFIPTASNDNRLQNINASSALNFQASSTLQLQVASNSAQPCNINIYKQETLENAIRSLEYLNKEVCYWVSKIPCNEFIDKYPIVQRSEQWNINDYPNDYA